MIEVPSELKQRLVERFFKLHPDDAARAVEKIKADAAAQLFAGAPLGPASEVFRRLNPDDASRALAQMPLDAARELALSLDPARTAGLLARLSEADRERLLAAFPPRSAEEIQEILVFPPGTAGHLMDARVTTFAPSTTVQQALVHIRGLGERRITDLMLCNEEGELVGVVALQDLVGAQPDQRLDALTRRDPVFVEPMTPREDLVDLLSVHKLASLPVLDARRRLVGVLLHSTLVRAAQQDAISDLQQMVGASREERALSSPWLSVRTRLPWLHINLLTAFTASAVVGAFEDIIAKFTALAVLLPVVAGQSGNTGAQAMAVTMRGLALREIRASHFPRVLRKEIIAGLLNGAAIALVTSIGVYIWSRSFGLAGVIGIAMVLSMCVASIFGATIPILLVLLKRDPATASSIILTTVTDVVGFFAFLGLATLMSGYLIGT
ncbi:MAG TPA: magnesium transporter [Polyangiaceae bacterium]|nr:magnesium transporter [Polyangiaceae bacterium]